MHYFYTRTSPKEHKIQGAARCTDSIANVGGAKDNDVSHVFTRGPGSMVKDINSDDTKLEQNHDIAL
jgi:hypothetical protein